MRKALRILQDTILLGVCFISIVLLPQLALASIGAPIHY